MLTSLFQPQTLRRDSSKSTMNARQQASLAAHIQRIRKAREGANQKTGRSNIQSSVQPMVGGAALKGRIASQIFRDTAPTWLKMTSAKRTSDFVDQVTNTTYTSDDGRDRSTPELSGTDQTSSFGSQGAEAKKAKEFTKALVIKEENTALRAEVNNLEKKLRERSEDYHVLEERYHVQRAQRVRDKETVDDAFEQYQAMEARCHDLEEEQEKHRAEHAQLKAEHRAQLQAKDRRLATLEDSHKGVVAILEELHQKELASKDAQITEVMALVKEKDGELDQAIRKAATERREIKAKAGVEQRKTVKANKINRDAWSEERKSMDHQMKHMELDYEDALRAQRDEIERLSRSKRILETANTLLSNALQGRQPDMEQMQEFFADSQETRKELAEMRAKYRLSVEKIENILESMQRERDHFATQIDKEKDAQVQASELQKKVIELEEKLTFRKTLLGEFGEQNGDFQQGHVPKQQRDTPSGVVNAINLALSENDDLRRRLDSILKEKAELHSESNKVDTENFDLLLKFDATEAQVHELQEKNRVLQHARAASEKEIEFLRNALEQNGNLTVTDRADLGQHLWELTQENQELTKKVSDLTHDLDEAREYNKVIHDKMDSEVRKVKHMAEHYMAAYFDEAVPKVERLVEEIRDLNLKLGRDVHYQERVERNLVVADRDFLRVACAYGVEGLDPKIIPAECYEPGFTGGWIPATFDALRFLRPLGWLPVYNMDKVWLTPMYKPFTEEDAAYRLEACEQAELKAHCAKMGYPPPKEVHEYEPTRQSNDPRSNALVAAKPTAIVKDCAQSQIPRPQHAAKLNAVAKAVRQNAPTAAYVAPQAPAYRASWGRKYNMSRGDYDQLHDSNKVDWVAAFVKGEGR